MLNSRQAFSFFGGKVGPSIKDIDDQRRRGEKVEHIHVVIPREERNVGPLSNQLPFTSIWIEVTS